MHMNRSATVTLILGLAGIVFLYGCGSDRKASAPQASNVDDTAKNTVAPSITSPESNAVNQERAKSAAETSHKVATKARPKFLLKKASPPNTSAKPMAPPNIASSSPDGTEEVTNPVRGHTAELQPHTNPIRMENPPAAEEFSASPPPPPDDSELPAGQKLLMREAPSAEEDFAAETANDSMKASPAQPENSQADYTVVKVFYGTDRAPLNDPPQKQPAYMLWFIRTIFVSAATLSLWILGFKFYPSRLIRGLAYVGMFMTGVFGTLTVYARFQAPKVDLVTTSPSASVSYGAERGKLELGVCEVSIPKSHEVGELESPSVLRLEFREDPTRHVILLGIHSEPAEQFFDNLRQCVGRSSQKSALVFVHGYNTTFDDAARRTAQIAYDLKFDGAPIFFSWPSQGELLQYTVDETNVTWTVPHLYQFLTDVAQQSGAERIHLVAHSMGNRALTSVLRDLALMHKSSKPMFNEVVLTAPDIDAEVFINDIAPAVVKTAQRVTLYASSNDEALIMSKKVHGYPRAGDSGGQLVVVPGIDTVDVSAVDTSLLGHNYYGENTSVLADIFELLCASKPADQRRWLRPQRLGILKYWVFQH